MTKDTGEIIADMEIMLDIEHDEVNPEHYKGTMLAEFADHYHLNRWEFNVVKYIARTKRNTSRITDLLKAMWFLAWEIRRLAKIKQELEIE